MKELTLVIDFRDLGVLSTIDLEKLIEELRPRYEGDADVLRSPMTGEFLASPDDSPTLRPYVIMSP
jgi:hypothetical protein